MAGPATPGLHGGQRRLDAFAGAGQVLVADLGQRLAAFPQRQGVLKGQSTGLQFRDHLGQLVAGLLVVQLCRVTGPGSPIGCASSPGRRPPPGRSRRTPPRSRRRRVRRPPPRCGPARRSPARGAASRGRTTSACRRSPTSPRSARAAGPAARGGRARRSRRTAPPSTRPPPRRPRGARSRTSVGGRAQRRLSRRGPRDRVGRVDRQRQEGRLTIQSRHRYLHSRSSPQVDTIACTAPSETRDPQPGPFRRLCRRAEHSRASVRVHPLHDRVPARKRGCWSQRRQAGTRVVQGGRLRGHPAGHRPP